MNVDLLARGRAAVLKCPPWRRALYVDAALAVTFSVLAGGTVLTGVILWAGGGSFDVGLLSALTTGGGLVVLLIRRFQGRFHSHKSLTTAGWVAARAAWVPLAAVLAALWLFRPADRGIIVPLTLATVLLASAFTGLANVTWYSWLAHLIPRDQRGGFLAQRTQWLNVAAFVSLPIVGFVLDRSHLLHAEGLGFAVVLGSSALCSFFGWRMLRNVPAVVAVPPIVADPGKHRHHGAISPGRLALYTGVFQVAVYLSAPFFQAYALQRLNMSFSLLMNLQVMSQLIPILTLRLWEGVIDRAGLRLPLGLCSLGKAAVPLCYVVATPLFWWPVVGVYVLSVLDAGITIANGSALAHLADGAHGGARIAHLNVLISITASITPLVAGVLAAQGHLAGIDVLILLFVLSSIGRAASGLVLLLPERQRRRLIHVRAFVPAPEVG